MADDRFISYAQNLEDVMLWRALRDAVEGPGFYIDVGAADPTLLNVTRAFYDRGWRGIDVEPLPEQAELLAAARPRDVVVPAALADTPGRLAFHRVTTDKQTGLSTLDAAEAERHRVAGAEVSRVEVPVTTLAALCREHVDGPVHFLKVDAEGAEAAVFAGADFAATRPWIILAEATEPTQATETGAPWEPALLASGYRFVWFDGLNRFYLAEEQVHLARHFRTQPNVFDNYVVQDTPMQEHLAATIALSEARLREIDWLETELKRLQAIAAAPPQAPSPRAEPPPPPVAAMPPSAASATAADPPPTSGLPEEVRRQIDIPFFSAGLGRRIGMAAYGLVRPVARPIAWRIRAFLTRELHHQVADIRAKQDHLMAVAVSPGRPGTMGQEVALAGAMERLLLTLALEEGRNPQSTLVGPRSPSPDDLPNSLPGG